MAIRLDLDVPLDSGHISDDSRLLSSLPTVQSVTDQAARVWAIGHLGRPPGRPQSEQSLKPVEAWLTARFPKLRVRENLRFEPGEEANDPSFAAQLVRETGMQVYVFEAFGVSHRRHASVVGVPKLAPTVAGRRFEAELEVLDRVRRQPRRPLLIVLGGAKPETKLPLAVKLAEMADMVLLGGKLPLVPQAVLAAQRNPKIRLAELTADGLDISPASADRFARLIMAAGTIIWNGPMGKSEIKIETRDREAIKQTSVWGTYVVARAMQETPAHTIVGGGDTEVAINKFGLKAKIDWISSGGGAMLHYLAHHTLPFLEAIGGDP